MAARTRANSEPRGRATFERSEPQPVDAKVEKPAEFQRFEDLAGKLAQVPKAEVDAKRKED
jgi:hypothetical protein